MLCNSLASERVSRQGLEGCSTGSQPMTLPDRLDAFNFATYVGNDPVNRFDPSGVSVRGRGVISRCR